jgi:hypothetical protein
MIVARTAPTGSAALQEITPQLARKWLRGNQRNRNLRRPRVRDLAAAMTRGEWRLNGETIKIAEDGTLLDGQHRLTAISESGVTIESLVVFGLPREAQDTVDTGRRRRLADVLKIERQPDPHALAAAVNLLFRYENGQRFDATRTGAPTPEQALDLIARKPGIHTSVGVARHITHEIGGPLGVFAALHCIFTDVDPLAADEFFRRLDDGANLPYGDAVLHLRRHIIRPRHETHKPYYMAGLIIKAFNYWRSGTQFEVLRFRVGEQFPVIDPPRLEMAA